MDFVSYRYNADQTNYKTGTIFIRNNYSKITARMNHVEGDGDLHFYYLKASDNTVDLYVASGTSASYKSIAVFVKIQTQGIAGESNNLFLAQRRRVTQRKSATSCPYSISQHG